MQKPLLVEDPLYLVNYLNAAVIGVALLDRAHVDPDFGSKYVALLKRGFDADSPTLLATVGISRNDPKLIEGVARFIEAKTAELHALYEDRGAPVHEPLATLRSHRRPEKTPAETERLHANVRTDDEMLPAPWVHRDEPTLHHRLKAAYTRGVPLDVVVGSAPGWTDPWSRVSRAFPATDAWGWPSRLVDEDGDEIARADVELARLAVGMLG